MGRALTINEHDSIAYASGDLFTLGSESRSMDDHGWFGEQNTGDQCVLAFSFVPVEVNFADADPVVLAPTTLAMTRPNCPYTREAISPAGQRTLFFSMNAKLASELVATHDPKALDRLHDPFPMRYAPSMPRAVACARQLERCINMSDGVLEPIEFDELVMGIVQHSIAGVYEHIGQSRSPKLPSETMTAQRRWVDDVITRLCDEPGKRWSLAQLADEVELSPGYLSRLFRVHTGHTLSQTLTIIRLMHTLERLPDMRGRLTRLAIECGFSSHAHMSSAFRTVLNASPNELMHASGRELRVSLADLGKQLRAG